MTATTLLSPELIRALSRLRLDAPLRATATYKGESRSRSRGTSVEFQDYREYEPGDDYRHIDWSIYNRLDRLFVKVFTEERNRSLVVLVDTSASMRIGAPSKETYARQLAAALSYVALWRGDEARYAEVTTRIAWRTPWMRGRHRLRQLFAGLGNSASSGTTGLSEALRTLSRKEGQSRIAVLISDLLDASWEEALAALGRFSGSPVLVHVLAPEDWAPQDRGALELIDTETGERHAVRLDDEAAHVYTGIAREWMRGVRERCSRLGIACYQLDTSYPLEELLLTSFREGGLLR